MVSISWQRWTAVLGLALLTTAASGQAFVETPVTSRMRQQDRRLNTPVSFRADRIYLGEALETLSAQTGVALSIDDSDSFSGVPITCDLKRMPLANVMNALSALVESRNGLWEWQRDTSQPLSRYSLHPTLAAHALPVQLNQTIQKAFEDLAARAVRLEAMSPEMRAANADGFSPLILMNEPQAAVPNFGLPQPADEFWVAIRLFAHLLSPAQRIRVLRGKKIDIPVKSMSEKDRQDTLTLVRLTYPRNRDYLYPPGDKPDEMPTFTVRTLTFEGDHPASGRKNIAHYLMISSDTRGRGYLGMVMRGKGEELAENWMLPGDRPTHRIEKRPLKTLVSLPADSIWRKPPPLDRRLAQLADTAQVSFMAVLPEPPEGEDPSSIEKGLPDALGKTPAQFFDTAEKYMPRLLHKWRDGILLATYANWFYGDDAQVAYGVVKRFRTAVKDHSVLNLDDIAEPISAVNSAQMKRLSLEFPSLETVPTMTPLCAFYLQFPDALGRQGIVADQRTQDFFRTHKMWGEPQPVAEQMKALRIVEDPQNWRGEPGRLYRLQVITSDQEWKDLNVGFIAQSPSR